MKLRLTAERNNFFSTIETSSEANLIETDIPQSSSDHSATMI